MGIEIKKPMKVEEMLSSCFEFNGNGDFEGFKAFINSLTEGELQQLSDFGYDLYRNCRTVLQNR